MALLTNAIVQERSNRKKKAAKSLVLAAFGVAVLSFVFLRQPAQNKLASTFVSNLYNGKSDESFFKTSDDFQNSVALVDFEASTGNTQPKVTNFKVTQNQKVDNNTNVVSGTYKLDGSIPSAFALRMVKTNDGWKVQNYQML